MEASGPTRTNKQSIDSLNTSAGQAGAHGLLTRPPVIVSRSGVRCTVELLSAAENTTPNSRRTRLREKPNQGAHKVARDDVRRFKSAGAQQL